MRAVNLKEFPQLLDQYISLRNSWGEMLLTNPVDRAGTEKWMSSADVEIYGLEEGGILEGVVMLYVAKGGEVSFFANGKGRGIGTRLLEIAGELAMKRGLQETFAWVRDDNPIAAHVFRKCGYVESGRDSKSFNGNVHWGLSFVRKNADLQRTTFGGDGAEKMKASKIEHKQGHYGIRPEASEFPMMCVLSFTYVCNAKCPNCPYTNSDIRSTYKDAAMMSEETFKKIADECGQYGAWLRISGGGEPLLHPQALSLFEYAKSKGTKIGLITNGSKLSEEVAGRLLDAKVDMVEISVDACDAATYSRVRAGLDWDTLVGNVKRLVELRNAKRSPTKVIASGVNQKGVDIDAVVAYWSPIVDNFQKRKYLTWGINDPGKSADASPYLPPEEKIPCPFIFERLNIDSRGKVMVCGFDIAAKTDMGNIHQKSIKEIWHSEEFEFYRRKHLDKRGDDIEMCRNCPDWKYRSWQHNYWKIAKVAEEHRKERFSKLGFQDNEGSIAESDNEG